MALAVIARKAIGGGMGQSKVETLMPNKKATLIKNAHMRHF